MSCTEESQGRPDSHDLFVRYAQTRDRTIRERLILRHLALVAGVVRRFANGRHPQEDLLQVGYIGLIKAIDRYEPTRGIAFRAYATPTIAGELRRYVRDKGNLLRLPRRVQEQLSAIRRESERLLQQLGREPTAREVAAAANIPVAVVADILSSQGSGNVVSLDRQYEPHGEGGPGAFADCLGGPDQDIENVERRYDLARAMSELDERERKIMYLHFFQGLSQSEIGARLRISQMHVSRLQRDALHRLRGDMSEHSDSKEAKIDRA